MSSYVDALRRRALEGGLEPRPAWAPSAPVTRAELPTPSLPPPPPAAEAPAPDPHRRTGEIAIATIAPAPPKAASARPVARTIVPPPTREIAEIASRLRRQPAVRSVAFAGCLGDEGVEDLVQSIAWALAADGARVRVLELAPEGGRWHVPGVDLRAVVEGVEEPDGSAVSTARLSGTTAEIDAYIASEPFVRWLEGERGRREWVLTTAPPLLGGVSARLPANDGVVLVARVSETPESVLRSAAARLEFAGVRSLGVVLTGGEPLPPILDRLLPQS